MDIRSFSDYEPPTHDNDADEKLAESAKLTAKIDRNRRQKSNPYLGMGQAIEIDSRGTEPIANRKPEQDYDQPVSTFVPRKLKILAPPKMSGLGVTLPSDITWVDISEIASKDEIPGLFAYQTMNCGIHGFTRTISSDACKWHREEKDFACIKIRCRHAKRLP